ncbi:hypothetical protein [Streptomyces sp. NPDC006856]|uniref:hypothetical protein n=1 Tax=Streptomyces sp. NPDC006856 TaxID=3364766 RepID=UPI0036B0680B
MQMSESFAATIAAVVPVIWLVGALEVHQQSKLYLASAQHLEATARRGEQLVADAGDQPTHEQIMAIQKEMGDRLDDGLEQLKSLPPVVLIPLWSVVVLGLLVSEYLALLWLATDNAGPHPGWATFLLFATALGLVAVTTVPAFAIMFQTMRHLRRGKQRHAVVREDTLRRIRALQGDGDA